MWWIWVALLVSAAVGQSEGPAPIKFLGIGNSFTQNATRYLGKLAEESDRPIDCYVAAIGGASLERHIEHINAHRADPTDPAGMPFEWSENGVLERRSLRDILVAKDWDYISIQQVSRLSYRAETYEPYASQLIAFIRRYAPNAEIVVHMTWAYREDHPWFEDGQLTQKKMADGLFAAYSRLAENHDLRVVPVGAAFRLARRAPPWVFNFPDPQFDYEHPVPPSLPDETGSLNVGWRWIEDSDSGDLDFRRDPNHANEAGCYLGSLVWFEFLTGEQFGPADFHPATFDLAAAQALVEHASEALCQWSSSHAENTSAPRELR